MSLATPVLDSFTRANEGPPPSASWAAYYSTGLKVLSNQCAPEDSFDNGAYWLSSFGPDVECYVTISTLPVVGGEVGVYARLDPSGGGSGGDGYLVACVRSSGTDVITITRIDSGAYTELTNVSLELFAGDKLGIRCSGSTISAWVHQGAAWTQVASVTDTTYSGASPTNKIALSYDGNGSDIARFDDFGGGRISPITAASETDSARPLSFTQSGARTLIPATSLNTARPLSISHTNFLPAAEVDVAQALSITQVAAEPPLQWVLEIALGSQVLDAEPTWTDISAYLREASWTRGRQRELDEYQAGTASFLLLNQDRRFDPTNTSGPYYPLRPRYQIRLRALWQSVYYPVFRGFVQGWPVGWPHTYYTETRIQCVDASAILATFPEEGWFPPTDIDTSGDRINYILNGAGWPASLRSVGASGYFLIPRTGGADTKVWAKVREAAGSSDEAVFVDGQGRIVFIGGGASGHTFSDSGNLPYRSVTLDYSTDFIANDIRVQAENGFEQRRHSLAEQLDYGVIEYSRSTLNVSDTDAAAIAAKILARSKDPRVVPEYLAISPLASDALTLAVLSHELEQTITLIRTAPPGGGPAYNSGATKLLAMSHTITDGGKRWDTQYRLAGTTI